jgi:hypothetical protein
VEGAPQEIPARAAPVDENSPLAHAVRGHLELGVHADACDLAAGALVGGER